ncbi:MAG: hypothetical protein HQL95_06895 [Magnetococcales bacterium]|nr:hypothetical protein [Magnetococcales bacterium]
MRTQTYARPANDEGALVHFIPAVVFKEEARDWMLDVTDQLKTVEERGGDAVLTDHISRSMGAFHQVAALRGLNEVADLALSVARALESTPGKHQTARQVVVLSLAAVSQIQWLLNPSLEEAGENARRIIHGLLEQW